MKKTVFFLLIAFCMVRMQASAATPTFTETPTMTATITSSYTPSATPTWTGSITSTFTPSATPTFTATITETFTFSPTISPTPSITLTQTMSPTITQTSTISPTSTFSPTATEVVNVIVSVNHNYFYPLRGETLELNNLNTLHGEVTVRIFNQNGTLIKTLMENTLVSRGTIPVWDGSNEQGERVASGVYVVMVKGKKLHKRFRVALIK